jgi:putative secretion ATPase (PEP-CTERM system associated)
MYEEFYHFREKPFTIIPNPVYLYPSQRHRMALTYLQYGLLEGNGFLVLTGEIGTGKTTLIRHILSNMQKNVEVAVIFNTNVTPEDLLRLILQEFEIEPAGNDKSANLDRLNDFLIDRYSKGRRSLLIIDEAQNLSKNSLEEVRMLSNLQTESATLMQIALVGQPELREKLRHPSLAQLSQRVTVSYHLGVMSRQETGEYIEYRLQGAGAEDTKLFMDAAVDLIHENSGGVPRRINILCDAALVYGYADEARKITRGIVEQVIEDREEQTREEQAVETVAPDRPQGDFPLLRFSALEARVEKLAAMIEMQGDEIRERMEDNRDALVLELRKMLDEERTKNEELQKKCNTFRLSLESLKRRLDDKEKEQAEASAESSSEEPESDRKRGGLRKWLGG